MKSTIFTGFFLLCCIGSFAQKGRSSKPADRFAGLDTAFSRVLKEWKAPGFAVAVVEKDKVIYAKGFGYKDVENKLPVTVHTQFAIGSCTKAFTAGILGILKQKGKIDFDKPVRDYLPEIKFFNEDLTLHVTTKDLMTHRTGIPRYDFSWYLWPSHNEDSLIRRIQYMEPTYPLRAQWQYNNWMYLLQGVIGEKLTGESWHKNIQEMFLTPLGMAQTNSTKKEHEAFNDNAIGYQTVNDSLIEPMDFYDIAGMAPAGSINSTVMDMSKWISVWLNNGKFEGREILPASYVNEAKSSQMVMGSALPQAEDPDIYFSDYGYGWMVSSYRGHYRVEHGGNIDGFSASVSFFPADSIGIVVLVNQNGSSVPSVVRNIITDRVLKLSYKDWQTTLRSAYEKLKKAQKDAQMVTIADTTAEIRQGHPLKDYPGEYYNPGFGKIQITVKGDSVFGATPLHNVYLKHYNYDIFDLFLVDKKRGIDTTSPAQKVQFYMNEKGEIEGFETRFEPARETPSRFVRVPAAVEMSLDSLNQYAGTYSLGVDIRIYTKPDGKLYMFVPGQPEYELQYEGNDRFGLKSLSGYHIQFVRDDKRNVIEAIAQQPNGNFKAKKKQP